MDQSASFIYGVSIAATILLIVYYFGQIGFFYGKKHLLLRERICLTQSEHLVVYYIIMVDESSTLK